MKRSLSWLRTSVALPLGALVIALSLAPGAADARSANDPKATGSVEMPTTLAGTYLAARYANATKDMGAAAQFFAEALSEDPGNPFLMERAFTLLIADGRIREALPVAEQLIARDRGARLARLTLGVEAMRTQRWERARTQIRAGAQGPLGDLTSAILIAWAHYGQGNIDDALSTLERLSGPDWYATFKQYHAGLIADLAGRRADALKRFAQAHKADPDALRVTDAYARALARSGRKDEAEKVLADFDRTVPDHPLIKATLAAIRENKPPGPLITSATAGAAELLYGLGAALGRDGGEEVGAIYLRLALHLDPKAELALVSLSSLHGQLKQYQKSIDLLGKVDEGSPLRAMTEIQVGRYYNMLDNFDEAKKHLEEIVQQVPADIDALMALGDIKRVNKKFEEAADAYSRAIALIPQPQSSDWSLFYYRGIAYERTKQWPKAEADFKKALELNPDEPHVLNYLGYSWIDMGMNLTEGLDLVKKAVSLRPDDGYIVDSLGWAYYKLGRYEEAVVELERAVLLRPEDPVINDHLGDAYWKVGRRLEAGFQWRHALDLKPEPEEIPKINAKIKDGLPVTPATEGPAAEGKPTTQAQ
jgi:tetratricopeptide (TPR) repeat protein